MKVPSFTEEQLTYLDTLVGARGSVSDLVKKDHASSLAMTATAEAKPPIEKEEKPDEADEICQKGFAYLFNGSYSDEGVKGVFMAEDLTIRYSDALARSNGDVLARVLFKAAQVVFKRRYYNEFPETQTIYGRYAFTRMDIELLFNIDEQSICEVLHELTALGVLFKYEEVISNRITELYYVFRKEGVWFPPFGKTSI